MEKSEKEQYKNLRGGFQYLVGNILGHQYYNDCHDVYTSDNECVSSIIKKFNKMEDKLTLYKVTSIITSCVSLGLLIFLVIN